MITTEQFQHLNPNLHYLRRYVRLVNSLKTTDGYQEEHHLLPRSMFPEQDKDPANLKMMSAKAHFICHHLLHKALPDSNEMFYAYHAMCNQMKKGREYRITARQYDYCRQEFAKRHAVTMKGKFAGTKWINNGSIERQLPKDVCEELVASGEWNWGMFRGIRKQSAESNAKRGAAIKKAYQNPEILERKSAAMKGNKGSSGLIVINDGINERKIPKDLEIPEGWFRGRSPLTNQKNSESRKAQCASGEWTPHNKKQA